MTQITGEASASGHITLLFSVQDDAQEPINQGSRGIGLCIDSNPPACQVSVVGFEKTTLVENYDLLPLYQTVIDELSNFHPEIQEYQWKISQNCSLPQQQGFGLSAAGSLATALAIQRAISIPDEQAEKISYHTAHLVERRLSGGLGDIAALSVGGVDLRVEPGCPNLSKNIGENIGGSGVVRGWFQPCEMVVAWRDRKTRHTSSYIDDSEWKVRIRESGERCLTPFMNGDWGAECWKEILTKSTQFCQESLLIEDAGRQELLAISKNAIGDLNVPGSPHLCLLGESVVIVPTDLDNRFSSEEISSLCHRMEKSGLHARRVELIDSSLR